MRFGVVQFVQRHHVSSPFNLGGGRRPQLKLGIAAAAAVALAACALESPQSICGSEETLASVRSLLLDNMARYQNSDRQSVEQAFDEMATIDLITFEGRDEETGAVGCRAEVRTKGTSSAFDITYARQPTVDSDYVYRVGYDSVDAWNALGMRLVSRANELERGRIGASAPAAPMSMAPTSQSSTDEPDRSSSAVGFRSLQLEGSDGVTLAKFEEWAREREGGDVSWRTVDGLIHMRLTWEYDDGRQTVVETTFQPTGPGRVGLRGTRRDGAMLTSREEQELIDGIAIDMYHRGMTGP